jgi:zinc-ribbon domain
MACDFSALSNIDSADPEQSMALMQQCTEALTSPQLWIWALVITIVCGGVGALIGKYKNAVVRDAVLGATLGPIGWIISLCLPVSQPARVCPLCGKPVDVGDQHCRHCGTKLTKVSAAADRPR